MAKQKKTAFGVSEDGLNLKLACLGRDGHMISLQSLEQVEMNQSLYQHQVEGKDASESKLDEWMNDNNPSSDISFNDFGTDNSAFKTQPYDVLFQTYPMDKGVIALNVSDDQLVKVPIASRGITQQQKLRLVKESIPRNELKDGNWQSSVISINDQAELWIHHGTNRLLEIMQTTQSALKSRYFFQLAEANETALANLFITNKTRDPNETSMVLYLGHEYRKALIFEGNKWTYSLPIHATQQKPDIELIYSKLSLALDEAHISDPQYLYVCGENCSLESVDFLRKQLHNTKVEIWQLENIYLDAEVSQVYDTDMIARFILPIALAWKALTADNPDTLKTNFLPTHVIENQKVFKIAWHGYLTFALLFFSSLYLTLSINQLKFDIKQEEALNKQLTVEYNDKKQQAEAMLQMQKAIKQQAANIELIKSLLENKNPWTEIITRLNNSFQSHPTSWINTLKKDGNGFRLTGVTTYRPNIVYFSNLFDNGSIISAKYRKIRSFTVWDFDIRYDYPVVDWYKMMEADAEQLRKYQEDKNRATLKDMDTAPNVNSPSFLAQKAEQFRQSATKLDTQVNVKTTLLDVPIPAEKLTSNAKDPALKPYQEIVTAFNAKNDWAMVDMAMKFVSNYPNHPLKSYVQYYTAYRAWVTKQYNKIPLWNDPILKTRDAVYPYALLLHSVTARDRGDRKYAEEVWTKLVSDYPQHAVGKTAKKLLSE
jgi:Tfp pilus assembly protein PilN